MFEHWTIKEYVMAMSIARRIPKKCKIIALVGGSCSGKTTMVQKFQECDPLFGRMKSFTTRARRDEDPEGEYEYFSEAQFQNFVDTKAFAWTTGVHGNGRYGTLESHISRALQESHPTVMHLEPKCVPDLLRVAGSRVCLFFITAPIEHLKGRIEKRDAKLTAEHRAKRIRDCELWESEARASGLPYTFIDNSDGRSEEAFQEIIDHLTAPVAEAMPA